MAVGINILLALGLWTTVSTGQWSFGHAAFMGIGAYLASLLTVTYQVPLIPAAMLGAATAGLVGVLVGFPALRLSHLYLAMATLGFAEITRIILMNQEALGGAWGFSGMRGTTPLLVWLAVVASISYLWLLGRSRLGLAFEAVRQDETAARAMGLNVTWIKVMAFGQGALITGFAGALYGHFTFYIEPNMFGIERSVIILLFVVFGGVHTLWGPALGAIILTLFPEVFRPLQDWYLFLYGGVLVVMMIWRPQGLWGHRWVALELLATLFPQVRRRRVSQAPERTSAPLRYGDAGDKGTE
jgi:branched-chain amino acid transport system permease protein